MAHTVFDPRTMESGTYYDFEEYCPFCDEGIPVIVDPDIKPEITCPLCGRKLLLCMNCPDSNKCDWREENGCYVSRQWEERHE